MVNEFEAVYIVESINRLGWQFDIVTYDMSMNGNFDIKYWFGYYVRQFKFPKEFKASLENKSVNEKFAKETFFNIF